MPQEQEKPKAPRTYVVKRGQPMEKFSGYEREATYLTDESLGTCDCIGFMQSRTATCKHLILKGLLDHFKVEELVFFGQGLGESRPKPRQKVLDIAKVVEDELRVHFKYESLELKRIIQNLSDPAVFNGFEFDGRRAKTTLVVGYVSGLMFVVKPS